LGVFFFFFFFPSLFLTIFILFVCFLFFPSRVFFSPKTSVREHLARLQRADLVLDTAHYGGHTTTTDALYVGVPVLTGAHAARNVTGLMPARVAGSILAAAGLDADLVAAGPRDYYDRVCGRCFLFCFV
jgi:predicted O-linked N-acetylglucosamine transferase (SPINDLY family)